MLAKVLSGTTVGLNPTTVIVEVDIYTKSLPSFTIVGLPSKSIEESKERVRSAIKNSGAEFPSHRITVNLAPADLPKQGPSYDLPIAVGILIASGQIEADIKKLLFLGELSLDGTLRHTNGVLPMVLMAKSKKYKAVFLPFVNAREAAIVVGVKIFPVISLISLFHHLSKSQSIKPFKHISFSKLEVDPIAEFDLRDVKGQEQGKRALEIARSYSEN